MQLTAYSYYVANVPSTSSAGSNAVDTSYIAISQAEIQHSTDIQSCLKYGVEQVLQDSQDYQVSQINSVYRQVINSGFNYKFNVSLANGQGTSAQTVFTIFYKPDIEERSVQAYSYQITTSYSSSSSSTSSSSTSSEDSADSSTNTDTNTSLRPSSSSSSSSSTGSEDSSSSIQTQARARVSDQAQAQVQV